MNQMLEDIESREDYIPDILNINYKVSHDPGCRPKTINDEQRRYLIKMGPFQPVLHSFPKNKNMKASRYTCSFSPRWYSDYPYIEYSIEKDMAYCLYVNYLVMVLIEKTVKFGLRDFAIGEKL